MRLKIRDSHLTCKVANKCLNERVEVVEWNKRWSPPFPCCPVSRQCPWKKTLIKKKNYEELWIKIRDLIRSVTKKQDDYYEKYITIKLDSDDKLPLNKTTEIPVIVIVVVRAIFYENSKYHPQVFLNECLHKI